MKMASMENIIKVAILTTLPFVSNVNTEKCKVVKFFGKKKSDLGQTTLQAHGPHLCIFWSDSYTINTSGYIMGWAFYSHATEERKFYLDLWRLESGYFVLENKTSMSTTAQGFYDVRYKEGIKVKPGDVIGTHAAPNSGVGIAYTQTGLSPSQYPVTKGPNGPMDDTDLQKANNRVKKETFSHGRMEAFGAYVLTDHRGTGSGCDVDYEIKRGVTKFRALFLTEETTKTLLTCAVQCLKRALCLTFTYNASTKKCKLYSDIISDSSNVPEATLETGAILAVTT